jgi:hypothetical protein
MAPSKDIREVFLYTVIAYTFAFVLVYIKELNS